MGTKTTIYPAAADDFPDPAELPFKTIQKKLEAELFDYLKALGLGESDIPLLWAADFIPVDGHVAPMVIGEFNCLPWSGGFLECSRWRPEGSQRGRYENGPGNGGLDWQ